MTTSGRNQQHTPNQGTNKANNRGGRWLHQDGTKTPTFHPKQALWYGKISKLKSYIQQWHTQLKGFSNKKTIAILQQCIPPPYEDIIQESLTLIECLQILDRFCAKETLNSKVNNTETGNTSNLHKESKRKQRQEGENQNPPSDQDSGENNDNKKISTTHHPRQFQWNGERITLRFYIQK